MDVVAESGRQILALIAVFGLLGLTVWKLGKKRGSFSLKSSRTKALESVERLNLTPQHTVHILRVHGEELLVATHPQGCTLLRRDGRSQERSDGAHA